MFDMGVTVITGQADGFERSKYFLSLASSTSEEVAYDHYHKVMLRHAHGGAPMWPKEAGSSCDCCATQ